MFGNFGWFMLIVSSPFLIAIVICCVMMIGAMGWFMLHGNRRETPHQDLSVPPEQRSSQSYEQADPLSIQHTEAENVYEQPRR